MDAFLIMLRNIVIFVALALPGYFMVKKGRLKAEDSGVVTTVLIRAGLPFLVISNILKADINGGTARNMAIMAVCYIAAVLLLYALCPLLISKKWGDATYSVAAGSVTFANGGFLGLPLCIAVCGSASEVTTYTIVTSVLVLLLLNSICVYIMTGDKSAVSVKGLLTNPVLIAFVIGLALNLLGVNKTVPEVASFTGYLGGLVTPLSMIILGMKLASVSLKDIVSSARGYYISLLRLILAPLSGVGLLYLLRLFLEIPDDMILSMFFSTSMPTAALVTALADKYGKDVRSAVIFTLLPTLLSVVTIPLLYMALCAMLG